MSLLTDPVFWVSIATLVTASYRFSLSQAYKSKCERFNICWGMVSVQRNVTIEGHIDEHAIEAGNQEEKEDV